MCKFAFESIGQDKSPTLSPNIELLLPLQNLTYIGDHSTDDEDLIDFKSNPEIFAAFYEGIINQEEEGSTDFPIEEVTVSEVVSTTMETTKETIYEMTLLGMIELFRHRSV